MCDVHDKLAKLTSYGCYIDSDFITAKYPDDKIHIVGDIAEHLYDVEQLLEETEEEIDNLELQLREQYQLVDDYSNKNKKLRKKYYKMRDEYNKNNALRWVTSFKEIWSSVPKDATFTTQQILDWLTRELNEIKGE